MKNNIIKILKSSDNINDLHNELEKYINSKSDKLDVNYKLFTGSKGKSGGIIGVTDKDDIIKLYKIKKHKLWIEHNCIMMHSAYNELIVNNVLRNLDKLTKISERDNKLVLKHTINIKDYGINNEYQYLIMSKVGLKHKSVDTDTTTLLTNLDELFNTNHLPWIIKNIDNPKLMRQYDTMITAKFNEFFRVLYILQKHVKYINTDIKPINIFIKREKIYNKTLEDSGCITGFRLLISDLDKANIQVNSKTTIIPYTNSYIKKRFLPIRYSCHNYQYSKCKKINIFEVDILCAILYTFIYFYLTEINNKLDNKLDVRIIDKLPKLYNLFLNQLPYSKAGFNKLFKLIKNFKMLLKRRKSSTLIHYMIHRYCNYLE
jgi:hypothetical protein